VAIFIISRSDSVSYLFALTSKVKRLAKGSFSFWYFAFVFLTNNFIAIFLVLWSCFFSKKVSDSARIRYLTVSCICKNISLLIKQISSHNMNSLVVINCKAVCIRIVTRTICRLYRSFSNYLGSGRDLVKQSLSSF